MFVAATPAQVFAAMSDPERVARWWGPDGFTNTIHRFDFRPGGTWLLTMHGPDGKDYPNESRFTRLSSGELFEIEHHTGHHFVLPSSCSRLTMALGSIGNRPSTRLNTTSELPSSWQQQMNRTCSA